MKSRIYCLLGIFIVCLFLAVINIGIFEIISKKHSVKKSVTGNPRPKIVNSFQIPRSVKDDSKSIRVHFYEKPRWISNRQFLNCKYNCTLTEGPNTYRSAEVVVFHWPSLAVTPPKKIPGQIWVLFALESPLRSRNQLQNWTNMINWTLSYRRDSDLTHLDGTMEQLVKKSKLTVNWNTKDRMAAWFVSHCKAESKRDIYASILQRFLDVDIYGVCGGNYSCPKNDSKACMNTLRKRYKFYLSFENSNCVDYITEKTFGFFRYRIDTIPVTRGGANYSLFFPPGSYLNTGDFNRVEDLAKEMITIAEKKGKFEKYFSWRINRKYVRPPHRLCQLCKRLHNSAKHRRLYVNIGDWLTDKPRSACKPPTDLH